MNAAHLIQLLENFAPKKYAIENDPIGLQVGTLNKPIHNVMVTLDVLEQVVDEAIQKKVDLIIAHHPIIYRPLKKVETHMSSGRVIEKLIKHDIAVYVAHTNLDIASGGVNDMLAEALSLQNLSVLVPTYEEKLRKLAVFVPISHYEEVLQALGEAGTGAIGAYSHCSFSSTGIGRFLPGEGTAPFIGKEGMLEEVKEVKIETIYPKNIEKTVLQAMYKAHPYEEPAYDIYELAQTGTSLGLGRIGTLDKEMTLKEFALFVKERLDSPGVRVVGSLNDKVKKVAVLGGDGNKYYSHAKRAGADVYVTGDFYFHTAHDAMNIGLNVVDPGHYVEKVMKQGLVNKLMKQCQQKSDKVNIFASETDTNPFTFV